jgi:hypothetical protein
MSYSQQELVARRLSCLANGRAAALASSLSIGTDPGMSVGICTIKIVTEEQVQAIGYGSVDQPPNVLCRMDPLSRDVADLLPFAQWLGGIATEAARGSDVRLWVPHKSALECIDVLGHRYASNREAPEAVQRMGRICRAFGNQLFYFDQPMVACAHELLITHFVTGQSPAEDRHMGSLLTWIEPPVGADLREAATAASLLPASGILPNIPGAMHDEIVEAARREAKRTRDSDVRNAAHARIRILLTTAVQREWELMVRARRILLGLPSTQAVPRDAMDQANGRLRYHLGGGAFRVVQPHAVSLELKKQEAAKTRAERLGWRNDPMRRNAAVRRGRLLMGTITSLDPYRRRGPRPVVEISTNQPVLRFRQGDKLKLLDVTFNVNAKILGIAVGINEGERVVRLRVIDGVKCVGRLQAGTVVTWENAPVDLLPREAQMSTHIRDRAPWLTGGNPPADAGNRIDSADLVQAANALVRRP